MENENQNIAPGTVLDEKYRIERIVGAGGMGAVYEATHIVIGRKVAIKTLHAAFVQNESVLLRFRREAELAGSIGHDNICEVTDFGMISDGSPYLVMPLLKGSAFADVLEEQKILPPSRLVDMISQTLSALEAAHHAQIVHRDLKPDNIFITRIGDRSDFVKLLDFGISKVLNQDTVLNLTRTGTVLGTPYYMSPEQAKGAKDVDPRSDIYATGVILYEASTGKRPFEGDSYNEVMFKIIAEPFPSPRELNPSIPSGLEQVIIKSMARDPNERFQDAASMRDALVKSVSNTAPAKTIQSAETEVLNSVRNTQRLKETATPLATELKTREHLPAAAQSRSLVPLLTGIIGAMVAVGVVAGWYVLGNNADGNQQTIQVPIMAPSDGDIELKKTSETLEESADAGVTEDTSSQQDSAQPENDEDTAVAAEPEVEEPKVESAASNKKKRRRRRNSNREKPAEVLITPSTPTTVSLPAEKDPPKPKEKDKEVEGRFGTKIVSDYDD